VTVPLLRHVSSRARSTEQSATRCSRCPSHARLVGAWVSAAAFCALTPAPSGARPARS